MRQGAQHKSASGRSEINRSIRSGNNNEDDDDDDGDVSSGSSSFQTPFEKKFWASFSPALFPVSLPSLPARLHAFSLVIVLFYFIIVIFIIVFVVG